MQILMKWTFLFAIIMLVIDSSHAWTIGSKGRVNGPSIHTTYFLTPNNASVKVHANMHVGVFANGMCAYNAIYDLGTEILKTGDFIDIDALKLKSVIGTGYTCMSIYYYFKQLVIETFQLGFDGINYTATLSSTNEISII